MIKVVIKKEETALVPKYQTEGSSGFDIYAHIKEPVIIEPMKWAVIPTGLRFEIPKGFEIQIRPRSGLATKGIFILNTPGTIDSDYRGEVKIIIANFSKEKFVIKPKDRIAQGILSRIYKAEFVEEKSLPPTARGEGSFGSTGI